MISALMVVPMLLLPRRFVTSSARGEISTRISSTGNRPPHARREHAIQGYCNNKNYGLTEEAEVSRRELERSFKRFADRSNSIELVYPQVRFVDPRGEEVAKVVEGRIVTERGSAADLTFFAAVNQLRPGEVYLSHVATRMTYAMAVYQAATGARPAAVLGSVVLDFVYPIRGSSAPRRDRWKFVISPRSASVSRCSSS